MLRPHAYGEGCGGGLDRGVREADAVEGKTAEAREGRGTPRREASVREERGGRVRSKKLHRCRVGGESRVPVCVVDVWPEVVQQPSAVQDRWRVRWREG